MLKTKVSFWAYRGIAAGVAVALFAAQPHVAHAWGNDGHRLINKLAVDHLPADLPAFLRSAAAEEEIEYLGPEPDRWRSLAEPELEAAQAPEHFIDLELADKLAPLPHKRFDFLAKAYMAGQQPDKIGLLPWQTEEVWERLKSAMRNYRELKAAGKDTGAVEQAVIFYAGWLGHYVGDGCQPLHTTVEYNGWTGPNPNGYTLSHQIHHQFETVFVTSNIRLPDVEAKMSPVKAIDGDLFDAYMMYLRQTHSRVEEVYKLDKQGGFEGTGTAASRAFTAQRLAEGASMLCDMIYTAWLRSADPVPQWHPSN
jgi:hypothetical protein